MSRDPIQWYADTYFPFEIRLMSLLLNSLYQRVSVLSLETSFLIQSPLLLVSSLPIKLSLFPPAVDSGVSMVPLGMSYSQTNMAQNIGNITISLGPTDLSLGALSPDTFSTVPTIVDNAFSQGLLTAHEISIGFEPTTSVDSLNGVLTWGISVLINE